MDNLVNLFYAAVLAGAPLLYGTLGEILTENPATSIWAWKA